MFVAQNLKLVQNVEELAKKKGVTSGQLALAWVTAQGDDVIPIPGTKRISCVDENVAAASIKLTAEEIKELEDAVPHHEVRSSAPRRQSAQGGFISVGDLLWRGLK